MRRWRGKIWIGIMMRKDIECMVNLLRSVGNIILGSLVCRILLKRNFLVL